SIGRRFSTSTSKRRCVNPNAINPSATNAKTKRRVRVMVRERLQAIRRWHDFPSASAAHRFDASARNRIEPGRKETVQAAARLFLQAVCPGQNRFYFETALQVAIGL